MTALGLSFFFSLEKEKTYKNLYTAEIIRRLVRWSAASLIVLPIVLLANTAAVPPAAVSGMLYSLAGLALVLFFAAAHFVYGFYRTGERQAASLAFFLFLFGSRSNCCRRIYRHRHGNAGAGGRTFRFV